MKNAEEYCDLSYRRLVGLKSGLYDIITKTKAVDDSTHASAVTKLKDLVTSIEAGITELRNECPSDWSPNKKELDDLMEELATTLGSMADTVGVTVPDTTAWI